MSRCKKHFCFKFRNKNTRVKVVIDLILHAKISLSYDEVESSRCEHFCANFPLENLSRNDEKTTKISHAFSTYFGIFTLLRLIYASKIYRNFYESFPYCFDNRWYW